MSAREALSADAAPMLLDVLSSVAMKISLACAALAECDDSNKASLIADALAVAGFMADRAVEECGGILNHGRSDDWFPGARLKGYVERLNGSQP